MPARWRQRALGVEKRATRRGVVGQEDALAQNRIALRQTSDRIEGDDSDREAWMFSSCQAEWGDRKPRQINSVCPLVDRDRPIVTGARAFERADALLIPGESGCEFSQYQRQEDLLSSGRRRDRRCARRPLLMAEMDLVEGLIGHYGHQDHERIGQISGRRCFLRQEVLPRRNRPEAILAVGPGCGRVYLDPALLQHDHCAFGTRIVRNL